MEKKENKLIKEIHKANYELANSIYSIWQFKYNLKNEGDGLYEQYLDEFRGKLKSKGFLKNLIAGTGIYYDFPIKGSNQRSLDVYRVGDSNIVERITYAGEKVLNQDWDFDVHISLKTPKGFYSKVKHNRLEKELNKIIRREKNEK